MKDKTFFFLILALSCFWLVLDEFYGKKLISKFITNIVPNATDNKTSNIDDKFLLNGSGEHSADQIISQGSATVPDGFEWDGSKWVGSDGSIYQ